MTKAELLDLVDGLEDDEQVDVYALQREAEEERQRRIEELEERQHQSGFYAFQDKMWSWRNER